MNETSGYDPEAFREFERTGWNGAAGEYNDLFGVITAQAVPTLLDAVDARFGTRLLDLACGTGVVSAGALMRGCTVVGADFADDMLAEAARRWPGAEFRHCDAEDMPFEDERFDAVASNFGFLHFPYPEVALAETARVLKSGGKLAFTAWTHDAGHRSLMARAIQEHGDPDVPLVAGPPEPFLEDDEKCARVMTAAGFTAPEISGFTLYMQAEEPARIIEVFEKSTVRTASRLASQTAEAREKIREALLGMLREYESDGVIQVPMQARLVSAEKR